MNPSPASSASNCRFRGVLLCNDPTARFLPSASESNQGTAGVDANALASRLNRWAYRGCTHPDLDVILSRPDDNDADGSVYMQIELSPSASGHMTFVFEISEAEATAQPALDWKALALESVPKLSAADQQEVTAMLQHHAPNFRNSQVMLVYEKSAQHANSTCAAAQFPTGMIFVIADDDPLIRDFSKRQLTSAHSHPDSLILGATFEEAKTAPARVMQLATEHGHHQVIALFDQNLDQYAEGKVFGSEMAQQLREQGFRGLICIRTSNNAEQNQDLLKMGVDLVVSKSLTKWPFRKVLDAIAMML